VGVNDPAIGTQPYHVLMRREHDLVPRPKIGCLGVSGSESVDDAPERARREHETTNGEIRRPSRWLYPRGPASRVPGTAGQCRDCRAVQIEQRKPSTISGQPQRQSLADAGPGSGDDHGPASEAARRVPPSRDRGFPL